MLFFLVEGMPDISCDTYSAGVLIPAVAPVLPHNPSQSLVHMMPLTISHIWVSGWCGSSVACEECVSCRVLLPQLVTQDI